MQLAIVVGKVQYQLQLRLEISIFKFSHIKLSNFLIFPITLSKYKEALKHFR